MRLYYPESFCCIAVLCLLSACSSRMDTNVSRLGKVETNGQPMVTGGVGKAKPATVDELNSGGGASSNMHEGDMATMEVVSNGCIKAWRQACNGDKNGSLALLTDLDKHYPGVLTIQMMMGQVYEHFGETKEAIVHYRKAVSGNEFSSFHVFKLAEALRKSGDYKSAADSYRSMLRSAPRFAPAELGLAKCLLQSDKQSAEARTLLSEAKDDVQVAKEAQKMLDQLEPGAKAGN